MSAESLFDEDRDRLLNAAKWPDSIKISPWYFKTAAAGDAVVSRRVAAIGESDNAAVGVDDVQVQPGSSIMMDITDASIATVVSVLPTDRSNVDSVASDNTVSLSDDTIICNSACNDSLQLRRWRLIIWTLQLCPTICMVFIRVIPSLMT